MDAETILPYLSVTALASTIGFFLCGIQICQRIKHLGTTDGTSPAPFLMSFFSCAYFIEYGILRKDTIIIYTNEIGCLMQGVYILFFYYTSRNRRSLNKILSAQLILIGLMVLYAKIGDSSVEKKTQNIGNICILLNIMSVGAPLANIRKVLTTKCSESMPLPLCTASFVVCAQWLLYGYLVDDIVILVPNFIATILSILQLTLIFIYPRNRPYSKLKDSFQNI